MCVSYCTATHRKTLNERLLMGLCAYEVAKTNRLAIIIISVMAALIVMAAISQF